MKQIWNGIQIAFSALGGFIGWFLGGLDGFLYALIGIGNLLDTYVLGEAGVLRTAVIFFYLSNEGVSLLENAAHLGLPFPDKLKNVLAQLHNRSTDNDKEEK